MRNASRSTPLRQEVVTEKQSLQQSPIKNLPNELLTSIFQFGVNSQYEKWEETNRNDGLEWGDVGDDHDDHEEESVDEEQCETGSAEGIEKSDCDGGILDFQVAASHVCRRWRSLALSAPNLWTILSFSENPKVEKAKEYILRSKSLPLTIDFGPPSQVQDSQLSWFLDLIEPELSRWRAFKYRRTPNVDLRLLMSRLHEMPEARLLESFRILYSSGYETRLISLSPEYNYLPFHGHAQNLEEVILWGAKIDWDNAPPTPFLRGLRKLEITSLADAFLPSYATFVQMIKNSPDLHTLALAFAGPNFPSPMDFDSHESSSSDFVTIPSLRKLLLQSYHPPYAAAVVRRLNLPNLHTLSLNFLEDCSGFIQTVSIASHGRMQSLLQSITCLTIFNLPCNTTSSVELFLAQLVELKTLQIDTLSLRGNATIFEKITMPAIGSGSSSSSDGVLCPKLEELVVSGWSGKQVMVIINARRNAGVPLKKMVIKKSAIPVRDLRWIRKNVGHMALC